MDEPSGSDSAPPVRAVFVYGTLRPGRRNWAVAAPLCVRTEPATLEGFALYAVDYPVVVELAPGPSGPDLGRGVAGDVLWLEPSGIERALERLDRFEGCLTDDPDGSYYRRVLRPVRVGGAQIPAWVYVPGAELLAQVRPDRRVADDSWPP